MMVAVIYLVGVVQGLKKCPLVSGEGDFTVVMDCLLVVIVQGGIASVCPEYWNKSCCEGPTVASLKASLENEFNTTYGSGACLENIRAFLCGWQCGPNQGQFVTTYVNPDTLEKLVTVYVSESVARGMWVSCRDICQVLDDGNTTKLERVMDRLVDPTSFLQSFEVDNFGNGGDIKVRFVIGQSPRFVENYDAPMLLPTPAELRGCPQEAGTIPTFPSFGCNAVIRSLQSASGTQSGAPMGGWL